MIRKLEFTEDLIREFEAWNEKFDEKLFSLDAPKGYKLLGVKE